MQRLKRSRCVSSARFAMAAALALGLVATSGAAHAALDCASLTTVTPEGSTITPATIVTPPAKTLSKPFYAQAPLFSYFEGCSNGGRQAMMMAQNYPELFDGIVAGAPSMFSPDLLFWLLWTGKNLSPVQGQPAVSLAKRQLVK